MHAFLVAITTGVHKKGVFLALEGEGCSSTPLLGSQNGLSAKTDENFHLSPISYHPDLQGSFLQSSRRQLQFDLCIFPRVEPHLLSLGVGSVCVPSSPWNENLVQGKGKHSFLKALDLTPISPGRALETAKRATAASPGSSQAMVLQD